VCRDWAGLGPIRRLVGYDFHPHDARDHGSDFERLREIDPFQSQVLAPCQFSPEPNSAIICSGEGTPMESKYKQLIMGDLGFLDRICGIIERLEDVHERTLARSALVRTCMKKQPRGKFTVAGIPRPALQHLFS
jgi:hypothetical protein